MRALASERYRKWKERLRDRQALARINARIHRILAAETIVGDYKQLGESLFELRFNIGPGYRVYVSLEKDCLVLLLLAGGDKSSQQRDIEAARELAREWRAKNG